MTVQQRPLCGGLVAAKFSLILLLLLHTSSALTVSNAESRCGRPCIPIRQCPHLVNLLNNPTIANLNALRRATCRVVDRQPFVCCPQASLLPRECGRSLFPDRIHGGNETGIGKYPWMAALAYSENGIPGVRFLCGGSVIHKRYILTAAHCLHPSQLGPKKLAFVRLGDYKLSTDVDCERTSQGNDFCAPPARNYTVEETIIHPSYNTRASYSDDIALIRLAQTVNFTGGEWVDPVCLPPANLNARLVSGQREPEVAGWGFTENGTTSDTMLSVKVPFFNQQECNVTYQGQLVEEQMCLGGRPGQDSCGGDSGGPLVVIGPRGPPYLQIGLVSYGPTHCGQQNIPGVYTSISHYREWIDLNIQP